MASEWDGETRTAWTIALAYSASEQDSLEKEVSLLQDCLDAILRLERASGFKYKEKGCAEHFGAFRQNLTKLAVFRTQQKQAKSQARDKLERTKDQLAMEGYRLPDKE